MLEEASIAKKKIANSFNHYLSPFTYKISYSLKESLKSFTYTFFLLLKIVDKLNV